MRWDRTSGRWFLLGSVLAVLVGLLGVDGGAYYVGSGSGRGNGPRTLTVCANGCNASVICGATCTTATSNTCVAGSAVEQARGLVPTVSNPVNIEVKPGLYPECVALNNITDTTLHITEGATVRPAVTTWNSVLGGVIRIGNDTTTRGTDRIKVVVDGLVQNDAFSAPEAGIQVGQETCSAAPTWGEIEITGNGTVVGHHDGVQWCGERNAGPATTDMPYLTLKDLNIISGRDAVTKKGNSVDYLSNLNVISWSNYCEDPVETFLTTVAGTAVSGAVDSVVLEAADDYGTDDGYAGRLITFAGGGCACVGGKAQIWDYVTSTDTVQFLPVCGGAVTNACTYSIGAVAKFDESPCRDKDWTVIGASNANSSMWKSTGVHFGVAGATTASSLDSFLMRDSSIRVLLNEATITADGGCGGQSFAAGILGYATFNYGTARFEQVDIDLEINADQPPITCASPIGGIVLSDDPAFANFFYSGDVRVTNAGDPDETIRGVSSTSATAVTVTLDDVFIDVNNTAAGYAGTTSTLDATAGNTLLVTGQISSPDLITLSAATPPLVTGWDEFCDTVFDIGVAGYTDYPLPIENTLVGSQLQAASCSCKGTCGVAPTVALTDGAGNAIATLTCTANQTARTFTDVSADADSTLPAGEQPEIDSGTNSGTLTDDTVTCLRYTTNRWVN